MAEVFGGERKNKQEMPALLDIVKLDGRWAQVRAGGEVVLFLDTGEVEPIEWDEYGLKKVFDRSVKNVMALSNEKFKDEEIQRIHWGPEEEERPKLRLEVTVFGEYAKKKRV